MCAKLDIYKNIVGVGNFDSLESETINFLRFPLIVLVIYIHAFGEPLNTDFSADYIIYDHIRIFFSHILSRVAVPWFYLISGYLFFKGVVCFDKNTYFRKLRSRTITVLVPYLSWNILLIMRVVIMNIIRGITQQNYDTWGAIWMFFDKNGWLDMFWSCREWPFRVSWFGWSLPSSGPIFLPMWFLRDLIVAFLLSYIIYKAIRLFGEVFIVVVVFCSISGLWPNIPGISDTCLSWFSMGAYMAINKKNMIAEFSRYSEMIFASALFLMLLMVIFKSDFTSIGGYIYPLFTLAGVPAMFLLASLIILASPSFKNPAILVRASFFVYACHTFLVLDFMSCIVRWMIPDTNGFFMILRYLLTPLLCAIVCLGLYYIMEKYMPCITGVLTGNRNRKNRKK